MLGNKKNKNKTMLSLNIFIGAVLICLVLSGCDAKPRVYRVGILSGFDHFIAIAEGFKSKMTELGYLEGKNIVYDLQKTNMVKSEIEQILNKFVADKVDLILVFPSEPVFATKAAVKGTSIPVVFALAGIEDNDIVESVRRPGGNITGVRYPGPDLVVKRFEILLELAPRIKRLYIPYDPNYPNDLPALKALRPVASSAGVTLVEAPVNSLEDLQAAFQAREKMADIGMDAIQILPELLTQSPVGWTLISKFAEEHKIPLVGSLLSSADHGGIFSYCVNFLEVGRLAAPLADKIFKGAPAGNILVVTPEAHLRINHKTANKLGLTVSESLLSRADEIIR